MQFNQTYVLDDVPLKVDEPMEQIYCNQVLLQNCLPFPERVASWDNLLQRECVEQFQQQTEQTMNNLYSKGHQSSEMPSTKRRELNRQRERKRQMRLKGAFNVLRSVIPDYFSEREPGDRLSRIQTLRLARKYIATLYELLDAS